jgi:hypothetical protein
MTVVVPVKTTNPLNGSWGHWRVGANQRKKQRKAVQQAVAGLERWGGGFPVVITLTRVAPSNGLDDDSLPASMKAIRDEITEWLGLDDDRTPLIKWQYDQRRGKRGEYLVEAVIHRRDVQDGGV